jgi:alkanesulfonate monooxygenase SsuD/methylene tetrahydromethanopterin reductase-like flavin-dependent oxidoreductase (luciferase family)
MTARQLHELGFYGLAGGASSSKPLIEECRDGDALGLGAVFISERYDYKEALTLCGAAAVATSTMKIITGVTNHNTRHPLVTAGHASTMHSLSDGRFVLGLGRGMDARFKAIGLPPITTAQLEDFMGLMKRRRWSSAGASSTT